MIPMATAMTPTYTARSSMRAAVLEAPWRMVVRDMPLPQPEPGWVRVRTMASGICGSDLHIYTGNHPWLAPGSPMAEHVLGNVYGHEVSRASSTRSAKGSRRARWAIAWRSTPSCRAASASSVAPASTRSVRTSATTASSTQVASPSTCSARGERHPAARRGRTFEDGALLDVLVVRIPAVGRAGVSLADHTPCHRFGAHRPRGSLGGGASRGAKRDGHRKA